MDGDILIDGIKTGLKQTPVDNRTDFKHDKAHEPV